VTSNLDPTSILKVAPGFRLQWEEAQACYVILYPEGMVKLSASAGEIMKHCDGKRSIEEITAQLNAAYPQADLAADVSKFLEVAYGNGWLRSATTQ
jgi:pyrroloquinoline quinone biosynthesis protein D